MINLHKLNPSAIQKYVGIKIINIFCIGRERERERERKRERERERERERKREQERERESQDGLTGWSRSSPLIHMLQSRTLSPTSKPAMTTPSSSSIKAPGS